MIKIIIITGHYGCGKTNVAVNIALRLAEKGEKVTVVDLDIVNPYFRTADFGGLFADKGIELAVPQYANSNLDIPALDFDLGAIINNTGYTVIDVGGDPEGAVALGRYGDVLKSRSDAALYYVINKYRYLTSTPEETLELLREIEAASGLKCSGIINNSNLGELTDNKTVTAALDYAEATAKAANLPLLCSCSEGKNLSGVEKAFETEIYVRLPWN